MPTSNRCSPDSKNAPKRACGQVLSGSEGGAALAKRSDAERNDGECFWYRANGEDRYIASRYLPNLGWFLVVDHDTSRLDAQMARQLTTDFLVVAVVTAFVLMVAAGVFRRSSALVVDHALATEQKHKTVFQEAAEQLYDNIYEIDITHNRAANEATEQYFESLGAAPDVPYDEALEIIAATQIASAYRAGYLETFSPEAVLAAHRSGAENLSFELKITLDGTTYHWIRMYAHLFLWEEDRSLRMLVYRQNIDEEKRRERRLFEQMQHDTLTSLYNKAATQSCIGKLLVEAPDKLFAFYILDIDDFKGVNDRLGHSAGDEVLARFGSAVRAQFKPYDIVGRIGGDEFAAFAPCESAQEAEDKAELLVQALNLTVQTVAGTCTISTTVGVATAFGRDADFDALYRCADAALYRAKRAGKNRSARYVD